MILDVLPNKKPQVNDYMHGTPTRSDRTPRPMTDEQARATTGPAFTSLQSDRVAFARRDLDAARAEDLAHMPRAHLILLVERLRGRLGDALDLIDEIRYPPPNHHP